MVDKTVAGTPDHGINDPDVYLTNLLAEAEALGAAQAAGVDSRASLFLRIAADTFDGKFRNDKDKDGKDNISKVNAAFNAGASRSKFKEKTAGTISKQESNLRCANAVGSISVPGVNPKVELSRAVDIHAKAFASGERIQSAYNSLISVGVALRTAEEPLSDQEMLDRMLVKQKDKTHETEIRRIHKALENLIQGTPKLEPCTDNRVIQAEKLLRFARADYKKLADVRKVAESAAALGLEVVVCDEDEAMPEVEDEAA